MMLLSSYLTGKRALASKKSQLDLDTDGPLYKLFSFESVIDYTLVECIRDGKVLLGMKKRGFGAGKWNGFGGKFDPGETAVECAKRELEEESGLVAVTMQWQAQLLFTFQDTTKLMRVHVFVVDEFEGEPIETDEMKPEWFEFDKVPLESMWHDDTFWLPGLLKRRDSFHAWFDYLPGGEAVNQVHSYHVYPVIPKK